MAFVGNYNGFVIYDVTQPEDAAHGGPGAAAPARRTTSPCPGKLLYLSTDSSRSDDSCASVPQPATEKSSWEGIKIFDISDVANPRYIKSVETACGSHTHSLIPGKSDYLYVSSYSPSETFPDCKPPHDSISIVAVPKKHPTARGGRHAEPVPGRRLHQHLGGCHDITVNPARKHRRRRLHG